MQGGGKERQLRSRLFFAVRQAQRSFGLSRFWTYVPHTCRSDSASFARFTPEAFRSVGVDSVGQPCPSAAPKSCALGAMQIRAPVPLTLRLDLMYVLNRKDHLILSAVVDEKAPHLTPCGKTGARKILSVTPPLPSRFLGRFTLPAFTLLFFENSRSIVSC